MERYFEHYKKWECWQNGQYNTEPAYDEELVMSCKKLLSDRGNLFVAMMEVVQTWTTASKVHLTNLERNRRAWLGQAACCLKLKAPNHITKISWNQLGKQTQDQANQVAEDVIRYFESEESKCQKGQLELTY